MRQSAVVAFAAISLILLGFVIYAIRGRQQTGTALASPTATATASRSATSAPTATIIVSPTPSGPATSTEQLADQLADALERSDYETLRGLIDPAGFFYQLSGTGGSQSITSDQAIDRFKHGTNAADGKLHVTVQRRPILPRGQFQPDGDSYISSTWMQYDNVTTQRVELMLKNESGRWYWRGGLFNAGVR